MFKRTMIAASLAVAALASAQSMAAVVGGGATLPLGLCQGFHLRLSGEPHHQWLKAHQHRTET